MLHPAPPWPLSALYECVAELRCGQRGGWTAAERLELLRQRWLADAERTPLVANVPGRTANAAWPQISWLKRRLGVERMDFGKRVMSLEERKAFITVLRQAPLITDALVVQLLSQQMRVPGDGATEQPETEAPLAAQADVLTTDDAVTGARAALALANDAIAAATPMDTDDVPIAAAFATSGAPSLPSGSQLSGAVVQGQDMHRLRVTNGAITPDALLYHEDLAERARRGADVGKRNACKSTTCLIALTNDRSGARDVDADTSVVMVNNRTLARIVVCTNADALVQPLDAPLDARLLRVRPSDMVDAMRWMWASRVVDWLDQGCHGSMPTELEVDTSLLSASQMSALMDARGPDARESLIAKVSSIPNRAATVEQDLRAVLAPSEDDVPPRKVLRDATSELRVSYPEPGSRAVCSVCNFHVLRYWHCVECGTVKGFDLCQACKGDHRCDAFYGYFPPQHRNFHRMDYVTPRADSPRLLRLQAARTAAAARKCDRCGRNGQECREAQTVMMACGRGWRCRACINLGHFNPSGAAYKDEEVHGVVDLMRLLINSDSEEEVEQTEDSDVELSNCDECM